MGKSDHVGSESVTAWFRPCIYRYVISRDSYCSYARDRYARRVSPAPTALQSLGRDVYRAWIKATPHRHTHTNHRYPHFLSLLCRTVCTVPVRSVRQTQKFINPPLETAMFVDHFSLPPRQPRWWPVRPHHQRCLIVYRTHVVVIASGRLVVLKMF